MRDKTKLRFKHSLLSVAVLLALGVVVVSIGELLDTWHGVLGIETMILMIVVSLLAIITASRLRPIEPSPSH